MANAAQLVLQTDFSTSRTILPSLVADDSSTFLVGAQQVLRTTVTLRQSGLYLTATLTNNSTQKVERAIDLQGSGAGSLIPVLNQLAKQIDSAATAFSTLNDRALQAYMSAVSTTQLQQRMAALQAAVNVDPSFGLAYITLAEIAAQANAPDIGSVLQAARSHQSSFTPFDRARLEAFAVRYAHQPIRNQEAALGAVLQIAPNQTDALVNMGTLMFLNGNADRGTSSFERAIALNPGNPNVLRAYAGGLIATRQFARAEKILIGLDNNPAVLPQLAVCVLLEGDQQRANAIATRLFAAIPDADAKTLYQGVWLQLSGQAAKANDLLSTANFSLGASQAFAYGELSIWQMMAHDFVAARSWATKAKQIEARTGEFADTLAILAAADGAADHWRQQVETSFVASNPRLKQQVLGYGFFLGGHYAEAEQTWSAILEDSGGTDLRARAMLAAAMRHEGKAAGRTVNVQPFVPDFTDLYAGVSFGEMTRDLGLGVH